MSYSEAVHLYKDIFKSILDAENAENKFNGIEENENESDLNQLISNRTLLMYVLFNKILVDLKQKIFFMQLRKNLKKNLVISLPNSFHIEKDENVIHI
jgi:hypothetical protein